MQDEIYVTYFPYKNYQNGIAKYVIHSNRFIIIRYLSLFQGI